MVYLVSPKATDDFLWSETDLASFGLALNISNISALEHEIKDYQWKTFVNGLSLLHLVFIAIIYALAFMKDIDPDIISILRLKQASFILALTSLILSYVVYDRLGRAQPKPRR